MVLGPNSGTLSGLLGYILEQIEFDLEKNRTMFLILSTFYLLQDGYAFIEPDISSQDPQAAKPWAFWPGLHL